MEQDQNERHMMGTATLTEETIAEVAKRDVRKVLRAAEKGITWAELVNHPHLSNYDRAQIEKAFDWEVSDMNIKLGRAATRYFWVGPEQDSAS